MFQSRNLELSLCRRWYLNYDGMNFECHSDNWYIPKQGSARYWFDQSKKKKPNNFTNKLDVVTHFQNKCAETNGINWRTAINWIHNIAWQLSIFIYTSHSYIMGRLEWNSNLELLVINEAWTFIPYALVFWSMAIFCGFDIDKIWYDKLSFHGVAILPAIAGSLNLMNYSMGRWDPVIACRKWYDWWKTT